MTLDYLGLSDSGTVKRNLTPEELFEDAIRWEDGKLGLRGGTDGGHREVYRSQSPG